jgi:ribosomal protein L14E/L6E/L27E
LRQREVRAESRKIGHSEALAAACSSVRLRSSSTMVTVAHARPGRRAGHAKVQRLASEYFSDALTDITSKEAFQDRAANG